VRVAFVLRSGGEYRPEHVARLAGQVRVHLSEAQIACFSDVDVPVERIPLRHDWPGWWAKMEIFRPDVDGDLLFMDLDTAIVGSLADMAAAAGPVIMRDVYRPHGMQSSIMAIPHKIKEQVWAAFTAASERHMQRYRRGGDQAFLENHTSIRWRLWQDICPGQLVSYKADVKRLGHVPAGARAVVFHGKPRPWEVGW
jgi:hypothetical protein